MPSNNNDNINEATEEVIYDAENNSDNTFDAVDKIKKLKEDLKACKEERQEYLDGWQRSKADFLNIKKRSSEEILEVRERAAENFILDLLPVLDSFDMAFKDKAAWESAPAQWRKGIEYIHTQILSLLETNQVRVLNPVGEVFDPNMHYSVSNIKVEDTNLDGKIVDVILKGYQIKDRIIRPAHVNVGTSEA